MDKSFLAGTRGATANLFSRVQKTLALNGGIHTVVKNSLAQISKVYGRVSEASHPALQPFEHMGGDSRHTESLRSYLAK